MAQNVVVVGCGIIGASIAYRLAQAGAAVTIVDAAGPAAGASGQSFGWINASFYQDTAHFHLRHSAIAAYHRLAAELPLDAVSWPKCLWWEETGAAFDAMHAALSALGYPVEIIAQSDFAALEPAVAAPPDRALLFPAEGCCEADQHVRQLLKAAFSHGAKLVTGCPVTALAISDSAVVGGVTPQGILPADQVVVAAGTGSSGLLESAGVPLPMLRRPGLLLKSQPMRPMLSHILVSPEGELRQDAVGRFIFPTAIGHQADETEEINTLPGDQATQAMARLHRLLDGVAVSWSEVAHAMRPMPADGLPAIGNVGPVGLYLATMHSGVTLAPLVGELVAQELMGDVRHNVLAPYRPSRFSPA